MKDFSETQKENVNLLLKLIKENPDVKILPMVDSEIVADDGFISWAGSFGKSQIDYIWNNGERVYFKSEDEEKLIEDEIDNIDSETQLLPITTLHESHPLWQPVEERAAERVANYDWEKVIVVQIGLP